MSDVELIFESPESLDDRVLFYVNRAGGACVSVTELRAMDSYNEDIEVTFCMTREQAIALRNWLVRWFPAP